MNPSKEMGQSDVSPRIDLGALLEFKSLEIISPNEDGALRAGDNLVKLRKDVLENENADAILSFLLSREILIQTLSSIQELVQIVDMDGTIRFMNAAFLNTLRVDKKDRLGKSIYDVSPDGALAAVLKYRKAVKNLKNFPKGSATAVISDAYPIYVADQMVGAIAFAKDFAEISNLSETLSKSSQQLNELSENASYLSGDVYSFGDVMGKSLSMRNAINLSQVAANSNVTVLIEGETGTGKELVAQAIHKASSRSGRPFTTIHCSTLQENALQSEFFGYEWGGDASARRKRLGKLEQSNGGTLFFDEIGDLSLNLQSVFLRVIQEKEIQRLGSDEKSPLDVRVIAATRKNLKEMIVDGTFREDLYYRLNVWNISIPPLRERSADIELLFYQFLKQINPKLGKNVYSITDSAMASLMGYFWPGNVRELENTVERAVLNARKGCIDEEDISFLFLNDPVAEAQAEPQSRKPILPLQDMEKAAIQNALAQYGRSYEGKKDIAKALGISVAGLYNKIKKYEIE